MKTLGKIFLPTPVLKYTGVVQISTYNHIYLFLNTERSLFVHMLFVPFRELFGRIPLLICLINTHPALAMCQPLFYKYNSNIGAEISWGMLSGET